MAYGGCWWIQLLEMQVGGCLQGRSSSGLKHDLQERSKIWGLLTLPTSDILHPESQKIFFRLQLDRKTNNLEIEKLFFRIQKKKYFLSNRNFVREIFLNIKSKMRKLKNLRKLNNQQQSIFFVCCGSFRIRTNFFF